MLKRTFRQNIKPETRLGE